MSARVGQYAVIDAVSARVDAWRGFPLGGAMEAWPDDPPRYAPVVEGEGEISETTSTLLRHWFRREPHALAGGRPFRYWPHQRRAVETFVYLHEVCRIRSTEQLWALGGLDAVTPQRDPWAKLGAQLATGSGKTKVMGLIIAWSYLNAVAEGPGWLGLGRHALVIAPGLPVKDRLLADFLPTDGGPSIFVADPVVPPSMRRLWQLRVYGPDTTPRRLDPDEGALIVTNIQQLQRATEAPALDPHDPARQLKLLFEEPDPRKLELGDTPLLDRLRRCQGLLVINDEAHHVWDEPGHGRFEEAARQKRKLEASASEAMGWIRSLRALNGTAERPGRLALQVDLSATLFEEAGAEKKGVETQFRATRLFRHTVVDYPLPDAIRDGIVKQPKLEKVRAVNRDTGQAEPLVRPNQPDAWRTYEPLLVAGIKRWLKVREVLRAEGDARKPILFILCADRHEAREVSNMLTYGEASREDLSGHRAPTGWVDPETGERLFVEAGPDGAMTGTVVEFHIAQKEQQNEAEWALARAVVNRVDHDQIPDPTGALDAEGRPVMIPNPTNVIVSVMMLKEGWDVRNVKVIVPLRPCGSRTLTEQVLGRGLRKMHPPEILEDGASTTTPEDLFVIQHPSFEAILDQIGDLIQQTDEDDPGRPPEYLLVAPREPLAARLDVDVRLVRFQGLRRSAPDWRERFSLRSLPPLARKLPWRGSFADVEISTQIREAFTGREDEGQQFILSGVGAWADYDHLLEVAYVTPLLSQLGAGLKHSTALKAIVKEVLETRVFDLPFGVPLSFDRAIESGPEGGRLAVGNLSRADVVASTLDLLRGAVREAIFGRADEHEAMLDERLASGLPAYQALARHVFDAPRRTVFSVASVENNDELRLAQLLDRADDVTGWLYNHRAGVGYAIEYDWRGWGSLYYPDFVVRARVDGREHNFIVEMKGRIDAKDEAKARAGARVAALLGRYDSEPWHYLLVLENAAMGRMDLSWWESLSGWRLVDLVRHIEGVSAEEGVLSFAHRLVTGPEVAGRIEDLAAEEPERGVTYGALLALGERAEVDPDRALAVAESMTYGPRPRLRRTYRRFDTGAEVSEIEVARLMARARPDVQDPDALSRLDAIEPAYTLAGTRGGR